MTTPRLQRPHQRPLLSTLVNCGSENVEHHKHCLKTTTAVSKLKRDKKKEVQTNKSCRRSFLGARYKFIAGIIVSLLWHEWIVFVSVYLFFFYVKTLSRISGLLWFVHFRIRRNLRVKSANQVYMNGKLFKPENPDAWWSSWKNCGNVYEFSSRSPSIE